MDVPQRIYLPCGATARFDEASGIAYRCEDCFAVVGSIGQPRDCVEETRKIDMLKKLGGPEWNYLEGDLEWHTSTKVS